MLEEERAERLRLEGQNELLNKNQIIKSELIINY